MFHVQLLPAEGTGMLDVDNSHVPHDRWLTVQLRIDPPGPSLVGDASTSEVSMGPCLVISVDVPLEQDFFVGGAHRLHNPRYASRPESFRGHFLSRFGFRTQTSGTLRLRLHLVEQVLLLSHSAL